MASITHFTRKKEKEKDTLGRLGNTASVLQCIRGGQISHLPLLPEQTPKQFPFSTKIQPKLFWLEGLNCDYFSLPLVPKLAFHRHLSNAAQEYVHP